jgi:hypothetical protein
MTLAICELSKFSCVPIAAQYFADLSSAGSSEGHVPACLHCVTSEPFGWGTKLQTRT